MLLVTYPSARPSLHAWPQWTQRLTDLVVLSAPMLAAVLVAGRIAADGIGRATGIRPWRWIDPVLGVLAALVLRAIVELIQPTSGSLLGPLDVESTPDSVSGAVVLILGLVLVSPIVEELYFRGLLLRAMDDALRGTGRIAASLIALVVSTAAFTVLHVVPSGANVPVVLLAGTIAVGLGCGILTLVTGRLGAAIVAHVAFNAIGVALLLM